MKNNRKQTVHGNEVIDKEVKRKMGHHFFELY